MSVISFYDIVIAPAKVCPDGITLTSATTKCCADLYRRAKALTTTALMTSSTLRIRSTTCPERFWATEPRKSCSSRNSTAYMLPREPRRREFSSLVATLLPRKTRGDLLQTQKLLQLAIAICGIYFTYHL